jgi:hypothetical protein
MKEVSNYGRKTWEPEFVCQGVSIKFTRIVEASGVTKVNGDITDGNGQYMGHVEVNDINGKSYVDIQRIGNLKRKTLVALYAKIHECLAFILKEQIDAEDEGSNNQQESSEGAGEAATEEEPG